METIAKESTIDFIKTPTTYADKTSMQSTSQSKYFSERYKNMTPEQREARRESQRLNNSEPKRKKALKIADKKFREMWKHTLHLESIAMENPLFIPELVWPTAGASRALGSTVKSSDWVMLESNATPLEVDDEPPPHEEVDDEGCDELLPGHMTHRSLVPSGQRHALLTHRNTMFEHRIGSNTKASNKDGDCMAKGRVDATTPLPQSAMTNNDDDEGDIFEDDEEEDEGYLFARQDEEDDDDVQDNDLEEYTALVPKVPDQYDEVYSNIPIDTHMLKPVANCKHCDTKRFEHESLGFCCRNGKIELNEPNIPDELMRL
ncbi:uncharacterized protein [Miscanthus floridulus]|uniref:uncharacterized protein n=1 Tax=Miscanthus floridulus TaxID=154761 RepID=UPI003457F6DC